MNLSILTTPGKPLMKIILFDQPLKQIYRIAALKMGEKGFHNARWAHSRNKSVTDDLFGDDASQIEDSPQQFQPVFHESVLNKGLFTTIFNCLRKSYPRCFKTTSASILSLHTMWSISEAPWINAAVELMQKQSVSNIKITSSGRETFAHFNISYCSGTKDQLSSAQSISPFGFC